MGRCDEEREFVKVLIALIFSVKQKTKSLSETEAREHNVRYLDGKKMEIVV